jgi:hypothetical protein
MESISPLLPRREEYLDPHAPEFFAQATYLTAILHHLWESYVSSFTECQLLREAFQQLQIINIRLCQDLEYLRCRQADHELLRAFSIERFQTSKRRLTDLLKRCEGCL